VTTARGYRGAYLIGFVIVAVVALRAVISNQNQPGAGLPLLAAYAILYGLEPWFSRGTKLPRWPYFLVQTILVAILTNLQPFADVTSLLYVPVCIQAASAFPRRTAIAWVLVYVVLLTATLMRGMGWLEGLALVLLFLAVFAFLISYDFLYARTQANQVESQRLLANLQEAHAKLQQQAAHAQELVAARERSRLARELHDSVSQAVFGIILTSRSARLLLERQPPRVAVEIERLQAMTASALGQLRALIAELHPQ
jgi:signal transduction histidine kinase